MLEQSAVVVWPILMVLSALVPVLLGLRAYRQSQ